MCGRSESAASRVSGKSWLGLTPQVWRYLVLTGDRATFDWAVTGGILRSPMADLLDGGFFHSESIRDGRIVEFDKQTAENADAMLALAEYCSLVRNPSVRRMADETWRYLAGSFRGAKGFVQGQVGADGYRQRSPRYSVPTGRLRESLTPPLQTWAREHLGLDAARFPQAVPFLATGVLFDPRLQDVMDALRRTTAAEPVTVDVGMADSSLTCAARSIQSARIWNDPIRLTQALGWLDALEPLRVDGDVMRRVGGRQGEFGYLGDYLAYADARLQAYVATGRAASFDLGLRVMRRARELFAHRRPGNPDPTVWVLNPPRESMVVRDAVVPEVADNLHESCTARVIRLSMAYGRLLGPTEEGRAFLRIAAETTRDLRQIALTGGPQSAGFFCAAAEVFDPYFAVTVGPAARELGDETAAAVPTRLVAPAAGAVRRDLQGRAPGVYVVGDRIEGPFTPKEAARELGLVYYLSPPH